jgi:V8-like Glu-specific endopeptidase
MSIQPTRCRALMMIVAASAILSVGGAAAQAQAPASVTVEHRYDSGLVRNTGSVPEVIVSFPVQVAGARWLRLKFDRIELADEVSADLQSVARSTLRITSLQDGAVQELTAAHCRQWRNTTAYFNGDTVLVEVIAPPTTTANRVVLSSAVAGLANPPQQSICGSVDDRVPSNDPRIARLLPIGCTAWIIDDCNHCMLTAGHCTTWIEVVEFNVPSSAADGTLVHPAPSHQYAVDLSSVQTGDIETVGDDWGYFGVFANPITGLMPFQTQGSVSYAIAPPPPFDPSLQLRVTGYGIDDTPRTANQVQQTSVGLWDGGDLTSLFHTVDTTTGSSGSPIIWDATGIAIGIHTQGGCIPSGGENGGAASTHPGLQAALATPRGVCASPCALASYHFDDAGNLGLDGSGNGHQSILGVAATFVPAACGYAARFGPNNNAHEFSVPDYDELDLVGPMTGMALIRPLGPHSTDNNPECGDGTIFTKGGNYWFKISKDNRTLLFQNEDSGASVAVALTNISTCIGEWVHVAFVRQPDGRTVRFFVNGTPVGSSTQLPTAGTANDDPLMVGNHGAGSDPGACEFNGDIDEIRIFDRALTNSQVKAMYLAGCDIPAWPAHCFTTRTGARLPVVPQ